MRFFSQLGAALIVWFALVACTATAGSVLGAGGAGDVDPGVDPGSSGASSSR